MSKIYGIPVATPLNPDKFVPDDYATKAYVNEKIAEVDFSDQIPESVLQYTPQALTEEQKAQARANIGVTNGNGGGSGSAGNLETWEIVVSGSTVTLNYTLEGEDAHTDVITFNADGHPVSLVHDGFEATGTWSEVSDG